VPFGPKRVAIVDDHELLALSISALVDTEARLRFVGSAVSVDRFFMAGLRADLVVLDLSLRDGTLPSENVARLRRRGMDVVALTAGDNPYLLRDVADSECLGMIRKSAPVAAILDAITRAALGESVMTTEWASALDTDPRRLTAHLTAREREVLSLYASGLDAHSVAERLTISENTVDDHIRRIRQVYRQIGRPANNKVQMYQRSLEDGLLPLPTGAEPFRS
jgi:DNA-binding NarL/FixJ family response regulator